MVAAVLLVGGSLGGAFYFASLEDEPVEEEEIVEAQIQNFEIEEELEEEPREPEPPPPEPPPPSTKPIKKSSKPTPQPDIQNPDSVDENPEEGEINTEGPGYGEGGGSNDQGGKPEQSEKPAPPEPPKPAERPKQPPNRGDKIDPNKVQERPAEATVPKQIAGNPPVYPAELKSKNIEGKVKVRLSIYKDGSVKAAKVLFKENSLNEDDAPELYAKANKLFLKAVAAAVQTWKFKPSMYKGKAISVYLTVTIPFTLH